MEIIETKSITILDRMYLKPASVIVSQRECCGAWRSNEVQNTFIVSGLGSNCAMEYFT